MIDKEASGKLADAALAALNKLIKGQRPGATVTVEQLGALLDCIAVVRGGPIVTLDRPDR